MKSFMGRQQGLKLLGAGLVAAVLLSGCGGSGDGSDAALDLKQPGDGNPVKVFVNESDSTSIGTDVPAEGGGGNSENTGVGEGEDVIGLEEEVTYTTTEQELIDLGWVPSGVSGVSPLRPVEGGTNLNIQGDGISFEYASGAYEKARALAGRNLSVQSYWRNSGKTGKGLVANEFDNIEMLLTSGYLTPEATGVWLERVQVGTPGSNETTEASRAYAGTLLAFPPAVNGLWSDPAFSTAVGIRASDPKISVGSGTNLVLEFTVTGYAGYYPEGSDKVRVFEVSRDVRYEMAPSSVSGAAGWLLANWDGSGPVQVREVTSDRDWGNEGMFMPGVVNPGADKVLSCRPPVTQEEFEETPEGVCEWVDE